MDYALWMQAKNKEIEKERQAIQADNERIEKERQAIQALLIVEYKKLIENLKTLHALKDKSPAY